MKISGIAAAENIDSAGEILSIEGLDISSIEDGSAFLNYEHQNTTPQNGCVGKILYGKKIFSEKDCETQDQLKWWNEAQVPYLYIIADLFDEEGHTAAVDIAAMLKYDQKMEKAGKIGKNGLKRVVNFSVEGGKLKVDGSRILKSLARKVSVTILACNKVCQAAIYEEPEEGIQKPKEASEVQKSDKRPPTFAQIKKQIAEKTESLNKAEPTLFGQTSSGKTFSHGQKDFSGWDHQDHKEAANTHYRLGQRETDPKMKTHHINQIRFHMNMGAKLENRAKSVPQGGEIKSLPKTSIGGMALGKTDAALEKEHLVGKMFKNENLSLPLWTKVQEFRGWLKAQAPNLSDEESEAMVRLVGHSKWGKAENALKDM